MSPRQFNAASIQLLAYRPCLSFRDEGILDLAATEGGGFASDWDLTGNGVHTWGGTVVGKIDRNGFPLLGRTSCP